MMSSKKNGYGLILLTVLFLSGCSYRGTREKDIYKNDAKLVLKMFKAEDQAYEYTMACLKNYGDCDTTRLRELPKKAIALRAHVVMRSHIRLYGSNPKLESALE